MKYKNFEELSDAYNQLYVEGKYQEGLNIIDEGLKELPKEEIEKNIYNINEFRAAFKGKIGLLDESMDILEEMIDEGYICALQWGGISDSFIGNERFMKIRDKNTSLRNRLEEEVEFKHQVLLPNDYEDDKKYPLCICLHGDGDSIEFHRKYCPAEKLLDEGFIVVYMQATQLVGNNSYAWLKRVFYNPDKENWPDPEKILKTSESSYLIKAMYDSAFDEIHKCYDSIKDEYSIDENRVVVSGFSGGATAALEIALSNCIPVRGFVSISNLKPISFTEENVKNAMNRGIKCVFMEGEHDVPVKEVDEMMRMVDEVGLKYKYYINKGIGHWYPDDIEDKLVDAIKFIFE
ncbi:hypothetical protein [Clostridium sp.]|uniref:hypothetical protein n=1 Tax=Clostridium sp. TaxID=1506 RepID=UPI003216899F